MIDGAMVRVILRRVMWTGKAIWNFFMTANTHIHTPQVPESAWSDGSRLIWPWPWCEPSRCMDKGRCVEVLLDVRHFLWI